MSSCGVYEKVSHIFVELFEVEASQLKPETRLFEDLGLDSLDAIEIAVRFQKDFRVRPSNQELTNIRTVNDVVELVARYTQSPENTPPCQS
jgi:acyl carrier protein